VKSELKMSVLKPAPCASAGTPPPPPTPVSVNDWKKLGAPARLASAQNVRAVVSPICVVALTLIPDIVNDELFVLVHPACVAS
jgi:hypothetical protein